MSSRNNKSVSDIYKQYAATFSNGSGAVVLEDLKKTLKHGENIHYKNIQVPDLFYELGRQSVINDILAMIRIAEESK